MRGTFPSCVHAFSGSEEILVKDQSDELSQIIDRSREMSMFGVSERDSGSFFRSSKSP